MMRADADLRINVVTLFIASAGFWYSDVENRAFPALTNTHLHAETISARVRGVAAKVEEELTRIGAKRQMAVLSRDEGTSWAMQSFSFGLH
jgi:hypothetical protein